jgi:hypothetical protein
MQNNLLFAAAVLTCAAASAETRYVQVSNVNELIAGPKYAIGAVHTVDAFKSEGVLQPRFFDLNASNKVVATAKTVDGTFDDSMLWTLTPETAYSCGKTHADHNGGKPGAVFHVGKTIDGVNKYIVQAGGGNALASTAGLYELSLSETADVNSATEFVTLPAQTDFPDEQLFALCVGWTNNVFQAQRALNDSGDFNRASRTSLSEFPYGYMNNYTCKYRVYIQIDSENPRVAAAAFWNAEKAKALSARSAGVTDEYLLSLIQDEIERVTMPEDVVWNYENLESQVAELFDAKLNQAVTVTVNAENGVMYRDAAGNPTTSGWNSLWRSTVTDVPVVDVRCNANNMTYVSGNLIIAAGQSGNATYTISCGSPLYYVSGVTFGASGSVTPTITMNGQSITVSADVQTLSASFGAADAAVFTMSGANGNVTTSEFVITMFKLYKSDFLKVYRSDIDAYFTTVCPAMRPALDAQAAAHEKMNDLFKSLPGELAADDYETMSAGAAAILAELAGAPVGKTFTFTNIGGNGRSGHIMGVNGTTVNAMATAVAGLGNIWVMDAVDENGNYAIRNYLTGAYLKASNSTGVSASTTETVENWFTITSHSSLGENVVDIRNQGSSYPYLHCSNSFGVIGYLTATTDGASGWTVGVAELNDSHTLARELPIESVELSNKDTEHRFDFTHTDGLYKHIDANYNDSHKIRIVAAPSEENNEEGVESQADEAAIAEIVPDQLVESDGSISVVLPQTLPAGKYIMQIPTGMFRVGDAFYSKSANVPVTVSDYLAIEEITSADSGNTAIYDLQGHRLSVPVKGINIIGGRKMLVK